MPTFLSPLNLSGAEIQNARAQNLGTAPGSPGVGQFYFDTALNVFRYRNSSTWVSLGDQVSNALFDANTILKADSDDTPVALTVGASTLVGRGAAGSIAALTAAQAKTVLAIANTDVSGLGALATLNAVSSSEITDGTILNVDINASAAIALSKLAAQSATTFVANSTGGSAVPTAVSGATAMTMLSGTAGATFSFNSQLVGGVSTPVSATDAANKAYVDSTAQGLDIKGSVRVASTADVTVAAPGAAIDGVTMAGGDRVLLKDQSTGSQNGIYTWTSAVAPMVRATDADASAEVTSGMFVFVEEGTANADKGFVLTTNNPITLGSTTLTFTQFSGAGTVIGTSNRITVTGNQIDISSSYVGQATITTVGTVATGTWNGTTIAVANGGTGAITAAGAKTNLLFMTRHAALVGDGASTTLTVTHNLGTTDVQVQVYDVATGETQYCNVLRTTTNSVTLGGFVTAPATNALKAVVVG